MSNSDLIPVNAEVAIDPNTMQFVDTSGALEDDRKYESYNKLVDAIDRKKKSDIKTKNRKCNIPVFHYDRQSRPIKGVVTGVHAGNGNILFKPDGSKKVKQLDSTWVAKLYVDCPYCVELVKSQKQAEVVIEALSQEFRKLAIKHDSSSKLCVSETYDGHERVVSSLESQAKNGQRYAANRKLTGSVEIKIPAGVKI